MRTAIPAARVFYCRTGEMPMMPRTLNNDLPNAALRQRIRELHARLNAGTSAAPQLAPPAPLCPKTLSNAEATTALQEGRADVCLSNGMAKAHCFDPDRVSRLLALLD